MTFSEEASNQEEQFLIDFLYIDRQRLASYTAQLFPDGHLTTTKKVSGITEQSAMKMGGGVPAVIKADHTSTDSATESIERSFDANWSSVFESLKEMSAKGYVKDFNHEMILGKIFFFRGKINILDYRLLQNLWRPVVANEMSKLSGHTEAQRRAKKEKTAEAEATVGLLEKLPHLVQLTSFDDEHTLWSSLNLDCLTIDPADLAFKYGPSIDGDWCVIGLLDSKPFNEADGLNFPKFSNEMQKAMLDMAVNIRIHFGCPLSAFGFTPIAVYRTLKSD